MASGDALTLMQDIAPTAGYNYQPSAGTAYCIMSAGGENGNAEIRMYNGTLTSIQWVYANTTPIQMFDGGKLFIDNTNYLQLWNNSGATTYTTSATGVQIK